MPISTTLPRYLPFPLQDSAGLSAETPADEQTTQLSWSTNDNDEKICIVLELSLNEYVALASAIDVGMDIAYNQDAVKIWWIWNRAFTMDLCTQIADCINTNATTQAAIINLNNSTGSINADVIDSESPEYTNRFTPSASSQEILDLPGCDKDKLWAGIRDGIVSRLDDNARNFLEEITAQADQVERAAGIIARIPLVGEVVAETIKQFSEIAPDLLNLFNAYSSLDHMDDIACDLFEMVCADCRYPTFDEVIDYYANFGISGIEDYRTLALKAVTDLLIGSALIAAQVCYFTIILYEMYILALGSLFNKYRGIRSLEIWASFAEDSPNDNWMILCDGCAAAGFAYYVDFTSADLGAYTIEEGTHAVGTGVTSVWNGTVTATNVLLTLSESWSIKRFAVKYTRASFGSALDDLRIIAYQTYPSATGRIDWYEFQDVATGTIVTCPVTPPPPPSARPQYLFSIRDNQQANPVVLKGIKIWRDDTSPPTPLVDNSSQDCLT